MIPKGVEEGRVRIKGTAGVVPREPNSFAIQGIIGTGEVLLLALVDFKKSLIILKRNNSRG